jgi:hypothetical protein
MPPPGDCPESETFASFLDGTDLESLRTELEAHLVRCTDCFDLVCDATRVLLRLERPQPLTE